MSKRAVSKPDIQRIFDLQKMILALQAIDRKVCIPPSIDKAENDVDHSFSLVVIAWFLAPSFPKLDMSKLLRLSLAHDMVEIYAGDTYSYDNQATLDQKKREKAALKKLGSEWRDFPDLISTIKEYDECLSEEAKFIYALDKLQPAVMDYLNEGRVWHRLNITFDKFLAEKEKKIPVSPEITKYYNQLRTILEQNLHLFPDK